MFTLETARLRFRELIMDDFPEAMPLILDEPVLSRMEPKFASALAYHWMKKKLEQYASLGYSHWHVSLKETGEFVGIIGVAPEMVEDVPYIGLGYMVRREFRRQGVAFEGARACLEWAFGNLTAGKIIAEIAEDNLASRALAEKLGMTLERIYPRFNGEEKVPYCFYSIASDTFCP